MTIATKNGAIIVKDGKLAENCECCGGWYCCEFEACAIANAIKVTFDSPCGGDLVGTSKQLEPWNNLYDTFLPESGIGGSFAQPYYRYKQTIVPLSALKGTHVLNREPQDPSNTGLSVFSANVTDAAGGITTLRVEAAVSIRGGGVISLFVSYPNHGWQYNSFSGSVPFKTLPQLLNSPICSEAERPPLPIPGDWECYLLGDNGFSRAWTFGCQPNQEQFPTVAQIRSRQAALITAATTWNCSFDCNITVEVQ
jgi:hypothetical protein